MRKTSLRAEEVTAKLRERRGNMAAVARALGVHRSTVKRFVDGRPAVREVALELRAAMADDAESQLYAAVLRGEPWAVRLFLTTQARDRGYSTRVPLGGAAQAPPLGIVFTDSPAPPGREDD
jgi:hypothetical protein